MADNRQLLQNIDRSIKTLTSVICDNQNTDFDTVLLCNPITGDIVITVISYAPTTGIPTTTYYNPNGTPYVGPTPATCEGQNLESDVIEGCALGVSYFQHVVKDNGQPTGVAYYTDVNGAIVPTPIGFVPVSCNIRRTDEEKICYSADGGITILNGWKRFLKDDIGLIVSVEILDLLNNIVVGAVEFPCPSCESLLYCRETISAPGLNTVTMIGNGTNEVTVTFTGPMVDAAFVASISSGVIPNLIVGSDVTSSEAIQSGLTAGLYIPSNNSFTTIITNVIGNVQITGLVYLPQGYFSFNLQGDPTNSYFGHDEDDTPPDSTSWSNSAAVYEPIYIQRCNNNGVVTYTDPNGSVFTTLPNNYRSGPCQCPCDIVDNTTTIVDGDLMLLGPSLTINRAFTNPVDTVNVFNGTQDYVQVTLTFDSPVLGNNLFFINPGGSQNVGRFIPRNITNVAVTHLNILNNPGGIIIINGLSG